MHFSVGSELKVFSVPDNIKKILRKYCSVVVPFRGWDIDKHCAENERMEPLGRNNILKRYFTDKDSSITLPRGVDLDYYVGKNIKKLDDNRHAVPVKWPLCVREPTPFQKEVINVVATKLVTHYSGCALFVLPVARGKTTVASIVASHLSSRTLIVVDTTIILNGWLDELRKIFKCSKHTVLKAKNSGKDGIKIGSVVTITTIQKLASLRKHGKLADFYKNFGTLILDECHISPANTYFEVINEFDGKYRIGITATVKRKDGLEKLSRMLFGDEVFVEEDSGEETETSIPLSTVIVRDTKYSYEGSVTDCYQDYLTNMCNNDSRNKIIADDIIREYRNGRMCVCVSHRVAGLVAICENLLFSGVNPKDIVCFFQRAYSVKGEVSMGSLDAKIIAKEVEMFSKRERKILLTTDKFFVKGASIKNLDTLFIATPHAYKNTMSQLVGRIRRSSEGKTDAIVFDYLNDMEESVRNFRNNHYPAYVSSGCKAVLKIENYLMERKNKNGDISKKNSEGFKRFKRIVAERNERSKKKI